MSGVPRKNAPHSAGSMDSLARNTLVHSKKEYKSLCSSNKPRHTFSNMNLVVYSMSESRRFVNTAESFASSSSESASESEPSSFSADAASDGAAASPASDPFSASEPSPPSSFESPFLEAPSRELSMQLLNMRMKKLRLYWYIGPMSARSAMTKYRMLPRTAAVRYVSRVLLMLNSVSSASSSRVPIWPEVILEFWSVLIRTSSSRMFPSDSFRSFRILSSRSLSCFLSFEMETTRLSFCSSRSGRSLRTTSPKSWSSRPLIVTVKLMIVTLMHTSGR